MKRFLRKLLVSLVLACALVPVFGGTVNVYADGYTVGLHTANNGRSQGTVGFNPDQDVQETEHFATQKFEGGMVTAYAFPAEGYEFYGWCTSTYPFVCVSRDASFEFSLEELYGEYGSAARLSLYAVFKDEGSSPCVVLLHSEKRKYGEWVGPYLVEKGSAFILPDNPFAREYPEKSPHYIDTSFLGWDAGRPGESITVTSDMTIEALWGDGHTANVFFLANGGVGEMFCTYIEPGSTFTLPECGFVHTDKVFAGWNLGQPGDVVPVERSLTLEAQWKDPEPGEAYRLEFSTRLYDERKTVNGAETTEHTFWAYEGQPIMLTSIHGDGMEYERAVSSGIAIQATVVSDGWNLSFLMPANDVSIQVCNKWRDVRITFDSNGGSGEMKMLRTERMSTFVLPDCAFVPPQGKEFDRWTLKELTREEIMGGAVQNDVSDGKPGTEVYLKSGMELIATWKDAPVCDHASLTAVDGIDATCETPGQDAYWKCTLCGKLFSDSGGTHEIAAPVEIPAGHDWGEWTVTKEPTATEEGEKTRVCKRNPSHTETEAIPVVKTPGEYSPAYGADATWSADDGEGLTFIIKRGLDDDTTYSHFLGASVDGASVPPLGYDVQPGSLELTLKPAYLASLAPGAHTLTVTFDDGAVDIAFTTAEASGGEGPAPAPAPAKDGLPVWAWILIGLGGLAVLGGVAYAVLILRARRQAAAMRHGASAHTAASSHAVASNTPSGAHASSDTHRAAREDATLADRYRRP